MRAQRQSILERMATLPEPMRSATYAHVLIHLDGTAVRLWNLPDRVCEFGTASRDPAIDRALEDTSEDPRPETARMLLRLMLASSTDDRDEGAPGTPSQRAAFPVTGFVAKKTRLSCERRSQVGPGLATEGVSPRRYSTRDPSHRGSARGCVARTPGATR